MHLQFALDKAEPIIVNFSKDNNPKSVNEIIELYNIQQLINVGAMLPNWSVTMYEELKEKAKGFTSTIASFFATICDKNFPKIIQSVSVEYLDDFWTLFERFKVYCRVKPETFSTYLRQEETMLHRILKHKNVVEAYDAQLSHVLCFSEQTCSILVKQFLENNDEKYYLPNSFSSHEYENAFQRYIESDDAHPNVLQLIYDAQSTKECPISDRIRLNAKHKFNEFWKSHEDNVTYSEYGIAVSLANQVDVQEVTSEGFNYKISYDIKYLEENLDFPTILNNFNYVFEMFDMHWRSTCVSVKSQISVVESIFAPKGIKFYQRGYHFNFRAIKSSAQMLMYYDFLKTHDIDLEEVFVWFFTDYLKNEFAVNGFFMKASSAKNYAEKCRTLASEMDGVLKQYRMYVRDGVIDRELFEMSSEHLIIDGFPSLIKGKYAYAYSKEIQREMFLLFSDQSPLPYTKKTKDKYPTFIELLKNEKINKKDFAIYQAAEIKWLIDRGALNTDNTGNITVNIARVFLLKDLYDHDVICINYWGEMTSLIQNMKASGDIKIDDTLFSVPEQKYLNFELNKSEYSDGLDLRNKYTHSTYPQNEDAQKRDYIELLKIMVLIISKINEEFCIRDTKKGGVNR